MGLLTLVRQVLYHNMEACEEGKVCGVETPHKGFYNVYERPQSMTSAYMGIIQCMCKVASVFCTCHLAQNDLLMSTQLFIDTPLCHLFQNCLC